MLRRLVLALSVACSVAAVAASWTVKNPTGQTYKDEAIRLHLPTPAEAFHVKRDGVPVPYQTEEVDGKRCIWVLVSFGKGESRTFAVEPGAIRMEPVAPAVSLTKTADGYVLDNGLLGVKVPLSGDGSAAPIASVKLPDGTWVGRGYWKTATPATKLTTTVIGDGTCFAKVRLRYDFPGLAGIWGKTPAYTEVDVALYPGQRHVVVEDRHDMASSDDGWEFDMAAGWGARTCKCEVFGGGAGRSLDSKLLPTTLKPLGDDPAAIQYRYDRGDPRLGDTLMWLIPRANQHYEDGWYFGLTDGKQAMGVIPARAGKWLWPHDNKLAIKAKPTEDYAGIHCPTWRGSRYWYLLVSRAGEIDPGSYARRHVYQTLDKLLVDYITAWQGQDDKEGFYAGRFNPMGLKRGFMRGFGGDWGGGSPMDTLTAVQVLLDPDMYGEYWHGMSPTNPNFFTDFYKPAIYNMGKLNGHPRADELKRLGATKVAEDVYHSITMPGGAGQECPGYMAYALGTMRSLVNSSGADRVMPDAGKRISAAESFLKHISQPDGDKRRFHPGGDTHPSGADAGPAYIDAGDVTGWKTEELPGFGVVFRNRPGTNRETYLAFKSGPNRGHYHGDQLSFHYCADAKPVAVDHHCSYKPRAGGEHQHNRVAFSTDEMPYANMDGYERLIALKTSADVDVSIGQVESNRLRPTTQFPPEDWDRDYPQVKFDGLLQYRRTIVSMKNGARDYFVIRDQYQAPRDVRAAFCMHVKDNASLVTEVGQSGGSADGATAAFTDGGVDFNKLKVGAGWTLVLRREDGEARYKVTKLNGKALELDGIPAAGWNLPYRLLDGNGAVVLTKPEQFARMSAEGVFSDEGYDFAGAGVQPGWFLFAEYGGHEHVFGIRTVDGHKLTLDGALPVGTHTQYRVFRNLVRPEGTRVALDSVTLWYSAAAPVKVVNLPWSHRNGALEVTQGIRLETSGKAGEYITVIYPGKDAPAMQAVPGGVQVGDDLVTFAGGIDDTDATTYVAVTRAGKAALALTGKDIDMERFQGDIGLFVPDTGYPFGEIPNWLARQRMTHPAWYKPVLPLGYRW